MLRSPTTLVNGLLELDEDFLRDHCGVTDFSKYSIVEGSSPRRIIPLRLPSLLVDDQDDEGKRVYSTKLKKAVTIVPCIPAEIPLLHYNAQIVP